MGWLEHFNFQIKGDENRPKLVFLHGLMGYFANWRRIVPAFESEYQVLVYDQRGHGRSFKPDTGYAPEDYADDLKKILDELGWDKIFLVGHSMGGRNALNFAFRYPARVEKLVIEDIGPDADQGAVDRILNLINSVPTPFDSKLRAKEFFLNEFGNSVLGQYLYSNLEEQEGGHYDWRFSKDGIIASVIEGRAKDRWNELEGLKVPTLVIRGSKTDEISPTVWQRMLSSNPKVKGVEIADAGHWIHFEQPEPFIAALKAFFSGSAP